MAFGPVPQPQQPEDDWVDVPSAKAGPQPRATQPAQASPGPRGQQGGGGPEDGWADAPETSALGALQMGLGQGATGGWSDEIYSALGAALSPKTYHELRDDTRQQLRSARREHPWAYIGGELLGSLGMGKVIGGIGKATRAGDFSRLSPVKQAAVMGGAAGAGYSEAELRPSAATPQSVGQAAVETAAGSAIGAGVTKIVGNVFGNARERLTNRAMDDITTGATKTLRDRVVGEVGRDRDAVMRLLKENKDLAKEAVKAQPKGAYERAEAILGTMNAKRDAAYGALEGAGVDVERNAVTAWLANEAAELASKAGPRSAIGERMFTLAQEVERQYGPRMSLRDLRQLATDLGESAWAGDPGLPHDTLAKNVAKRVQTGLVDLLHTAIESSPRLPAEAAKLASDEIRGLNKDLQKMINIKEALLDRATREATGSTRWKQTLARHALSEDIWNRDFPKAAAKVVWGEIGKPVQNATDLALARLMEAAPGSTHAQMIKLAASLGLSSAVGTQAWKWAQRAYQPDEYVPAATKFDRW